MESRNYIIKKDKKKKQIISFEYEEMNGYQVSPKVHNENQVKVNKIIFVKPEFSEKIIRKKIDKRIEYLLKMLKMIEEGSDTSPDTIERTLMESEKLRMQIINNYVKYLGNTYQSLTMEKIKLINDRLRYHLYYLKELKKQEYYQEERKVGRGR